MTISHDEFKTGINESRNTEYGDDSVEISGKNLQGWSIEALNEAIGWRRRYESFIFTGLSEPIINRLRNFTSAEAAVSEGACVIATDIKGSTRLDPEGIVEILRLIPEVIITNAIYFESFFRRNDYGNDSDTISRTSKGICPIKIAGDGVEMMGVFEDPYLRTASMLLTALSLLKKSDEKLRVGVFDKPTAESDPAIMWKTYVALNDIDNILGETVMPMESEAMQVRKWSCDDDIDCGLKIRITRQTAELFAKTCSNLTIIRESIGGKTLYRADLSNYENITVHRSDGTDPINLGTMLDNSEQVFDLFKVQVESLIHKYDGANVTEVVSCVPDSTFIFLNPVNCSTSDQYDEFFGACAEISQKIFCLDPGRQEIPDVNDKGFIVITTTTEDLKKVIEVSTTSPDLVFPVITTGSAKTVFVPGLGRIMLSKFGSGVAKQSNLKAGGYTPRKGEIARFYGGLGIVLPAGIVCSAGYDYDRDLASYEIKGIEDGIYTGEYETDKNTFIERNLGLQPVLLLYREFQSEFNRYLERGDFYTLEFRLRQLKEVDPRFVTSKGQTQHRISSETIKAQKEYMGNFSEEQKTIFDLINLVQSISEDDLLSLGESIGYRKDMIMTLIQNLEYHAFIKRVQSQESDTRSQELIQTNRLYVENIECESLEGLVEKLGAKDSICANALVRRLIYLADTVSNPYSRACIELVVSRFHLTRGFELSAGDYKMRAASNLLKFIAASYSVGVGYSGERSDSSQVFPDVIHNLDPDIFTNTQDKLKVILARIDYLSQLVSPSKEAVDMLEKSREEFLNILSRDKQDILGNDEEAEVFAEMLSRIADADRDGDKRIYSVVSGMISEKDRRVSPRLKATLLYGIFGEDHYRMEGTYEEINLKTIERANYIIRFGSKRIREYAMLSMYSMAARGSVSFGILKDGRLFSDAQMQNESWFIEECRNMLLNSHEQGINNAIVRTRAMVNLVPLLLFNNQQEAAIEVAKDSYFEALRTGREDEIGAAYSTLLALYLKLNEKPFELTKETILDAIIFGHDYLTSRSAVPRMTYNLVNQANNTVMLMCEDDKLLNGGGDDYYLIRSDLLSVIKKLLIAGYGKKWKAEAIAIFVEDYLLQTGDYCMKIIQEMVEDILSGYECNSVREYLNESGIDIEDIKKLSEQVGEPKQETEGKTKLVNEITGLVKKHGLAHGILIEKMKKEVQILDVREPDQLKDFLEKYSIQLNYPHSALAYLKEVLISENI
ncbi:hypothetical protein JW796_01250 [Candidatus Dojkabacteria bacterium]|nr:hypothetical protein [Candidatus Dojkabacteria bacterium]